MASSEFLVNCITFFFVNLIYTLSTTSEPAYIIIILILPCILVVSEHYIYFQTRKKYYELIEKYFIWYYISNYVIPQRLIVTKYNNNQKCIELQECNKIAEKLFMLNEHEDIDSLTSKIKVS